MHKIVGELTLTQSINREEVNALDVVIYASDGVQTTEWSRRIEVNPDDVYHYAKQNLTALFQIQDVNDNAPIFESSTFSFDIFENAERGSVVGRVEATDADQANSPRQVCVS